MNTLKCTQTRLVYVETRDRQWNGSYRQSLSNHTISWWFVVLHQAGEEYTISLGYTLKANDRRSVLERNMKMNLIQTAVINQSDQ